MNWKKNTLIVLVCFVAIGVTSAVIMNQWSTIKAWTVKKLAIEKPAKVIIETKIEYRDRWRNRVIIEQPDGTKITHENSHETSGTTLTANTTSIPIIPESKQENKNSSSYYITGGIGFSLGNIDPIYVIGGGVHITSWLSVGVQLQSNSQYKTAGLALVTISF